MLRRAGWAGAVASERPAAGQGESPCAGAAGLPRGGSAGPAAGQVGGEGGGHLHPVAGVWRAEQERG